VKESGTTVTEIFGVGPVVAATVIGSVYNVARFATKDRFAAYNGTAPIEASSGNNKIYRLSRRGNRQMNHAIHMAAVTQISHRHTKGRAYYDHKIAEGMSHKSAVRALKRRISDALYARMLADARRIAPEVEEGPGGQSGNDSVASVTGSHPAGRLFGEATPEPATTLRPAAIAARSRRPKTPSRRVEKAS
jgi:hypothetical protein